MPTLAFFPWLSVADTINLGRFRLSRYEREGTWPADVHRILSAYEQMPEKSIETATVVFVDGVLGGELVDADADDLFDLRRAMSFAGLRHRRFFNHAGYVNDHAFALVLQNFKPGQGGVGVTARRRDGDHSALWPNGWRVRCPDHVSPVVDGHVDAPLVDAVRAAMKAPEGDAIHDAIELFALANTDSPDVRPHTELVLTVAATQRLLGVEKRSDTRMIAQRFSEALSAIPPERAPSDSRRAIPVSKQSSTLREIWFEDFYASRGVIAHGRPTGRPTAVWGLAEHLLLSSYIFPRLALLHLAAGGFYTPSEREKGEIGGFDYLLCPSTLFGPPDRTDDNEPPSECHRSAGPWAWTEALFEASSDRNIRKYARLLEQELSGVSEHDGPVGAAADVRSPDSSHHHEVPDEAPSHD